MYYLRMTQSSIWLSESEASAVLRVDEKMLEGLREKGVLKPGYHWRSSNDPEQLPWKPKVLYCKSSFKEIIKYFVSTSSFDQIAA